MADERVNWKLKFKDLKKDFDAEYDKGQVLKVENDGLKSTIFNLRQTLTEICDGMKR